MTIKELRNYFEKTASPKFFLTDVFSWRGVYSEVAFTPSKNGTKEESLALIDRAISEEFRGYKGGYFKYNEDTEIHFETDESSYFDLKIEF